MQPVDMPAAWKPYARRTARQGPGLLGAWCIATWRRVIMTSSTAVAVLVQACRPVTWRRTVRAELVRNCVQVALYGSPSSSLPDCWSGWRW